MLPVDQSNKQTGGGAQLSGIPGSGLLPAWVPAPQTPPVSVALQDPFFACDVCRVQVPTWYHMKSLYKISLIGSS